MEKYCKTKVSHKEWRRIAKKERRRRVRREDARRRYDEEKRQSAALELSAGDLKLHEEKEKMEMEIEAREQQERERRWLEEEARVQKEWQILQRQKAKEMREEEKRRMKLDKKFEAKKEELERKEREKRHRRKKQLQKRQQVLKDIEDYIENGGKTPEALRQVKETQPGKDFCPFFTKTGACRYGDKCSKNHRIVFLSKVILIPGFYSHFSLEKNSAEYDTDVMLEYEDSETWQHYREFYEDVITELKSYGRINVFKCCCNTESHLRGNLYVEYETEREAIRACRKLNGRWYAGKQLRCEFANLTSWRSAICGMAQCPKGTACNFLHTFQNPRDEYSVKDVTFKHLKRVLQMSNNSKKSKRRGKSRWEEVTQNNGEEDRNWRWSESPEIELEARSKDTNRKLRHSAEKERSWSFRGRRYEQSENSSTRSSNSLLHLKSPEELRQSRSRRRTHGDEESASDGRSSKRRKRKSEGTSVNEDSHKEATRKC